MDRESDSDTSHGEAADYSSDDEVEEIFVPYGERDEWRDVQPVAENYEDQLVVAIDYSDKFRDVFNYFRAILLKDEKSERSFKLTTDCIALNPANYTVWYFRRKILKHLEMNLKKELTFVDSVIIGSSKNYQVWQHRKWLVENLNDPSGEKTFLDVLHREDDKNYHVWQYRQWLIKHFSLWEGEIAFTTKMIDNDIRNNSAWNHRYYVFYETGKSLDSDAIQEEVNFCLQKIRLAPNNESAWNYLRGILQEVGLSKNEMVNEYCEEMLNNNTVNCHLMQFILDAIEETLRESFKQDDTLVRKAVDLTVKLETEIDPLRKDYWIFIRKSFLEEFSTE